MSATRWKIWNALMLCLTGFAVAATEPFFFVQLSDPQLGMFTDNRDFTQETANLEFAVATINRLRPAFVVVTGDLVNQPGHAAQIHEYQRIIHQIAPDIPVHSLPGNHDVGNHPTAASVAAYTNHFGPDHYTFRHDSFVGIGLNSTLIHSPQHAPALAAAQEQWLASELQQARAAGARHIVIFAHHPWFLKSADEPDEYFNIPAEHRRRHLQWFREAGVTHLFSGHYHRNAVGRDGDLEAVTTGPVGMPLAGGKSGLRIVVVRDEGLAHRYYDFGELPKTVDLPVPAATGKQ
ncbi:MAG TPA: metallophosphoesterase [Verrucomicrobiota bacterium]|nr:metallophosphoesterase [Verrucomicrobiota bacterium]HNT15052.1 metallophosphoesterase [Verrucomicrobiota bacterium]